ncbi:MAG: hypothetical protein P4L98_12010 [Ancalomicrobiaceae bacterium]|nr:hypothetical protein [Ancalomicrobiaceae bacterium]
MLKLTTLTALIVGLLLAMPIVFSDAEAGRSAVTDFSLGQRGDRIADGRIDDAFRLVAACNTQASATCRTTLAETPTGAGTVTIEERDEAHQMSTLVRLPAKDPLAP